MACAGLAAVAHAGRALHRERVSSLGLDGQGSRRLRHDDIRHRVRMPAGLGTGREAPLGHAESVVVDLDGWGGGGASHDTTLPVTTMRRPSA
ncbi:hypothetical protein ACFPRL_09585 [Pseudoclavibacter helvolus]